MHNPHQEPYQSAHLFLVLWKAAQALREHDLSSIESSGLCYSDFVTLEVLLHKGPLPVNLIGEKVQLTSGAISTAIDRLEQRKLVQRQASAQDRRVRLVHLTQAGKTLIERFFEQHVQALQYATSGLADTEKKQLIGLLKKLGQHAKNLPQKHFGPTATSD